MLVDSIESARNKIIECSGVGVYLKDHLVPRLPAMGKDTSHWTRLFKVLSNLILNTARIGVSTTSLGNLFQSLTTLKMKIFFLILNLIFPSFSFTPFSIDAFSVLKS